MDARVGLIIPSSNRMVEQEMVHAFPDGIHAHITRLRMTGPNRMGHDQLIPRVEEATPRARRCQVRRGGVPLHREFDGGGAGR